MDEECFRLVVFMMGGGDVLGVRFFADFFEKPVSDIAEPPLKIAFREYFRMKDEEREIIAAGERFDKEFIGIGIFSAQSVVDMGERDAKGIFSLQVSENIEKANAIRPS